VALREPSIIIFHDANFFCRAGLVHRLDRDTSGCLLIAKTHLALAALGKQFADRSVTKRYLAVVHGCPGHVVLRERISSSQHAGNDRRARIAVPPYSSNGKSAVTAVSTLSFSRGLSVIEALIGTGRTHQIRVHLSSCGSPVFGDILYGGARFIQDGEKHPQATITALRPMLHAHTLVFKHPVSLKDIIVTAPPPEDMMSLLRVLAPSMWPPSLLEQCV
jgi:23S rRNA pseudouridine1911/1915/1917 synthase